MRGLIAGRGLAGLLSRETSWRRLLVFLVASGLLVSGFLTEEGWLWVALAYIGTEGAQRLAETRRPTATPPSSAPPRMPEDEAPPET